MKTQVGIVGAGPGGMFLAHLLRRAGVSSIVVESRTRRDVEETVRASLLEYWVVQLMNELGVGDRMMRQGNLDDGITLQWERTRFHIDVAGLTDGQLAVVYPQHEVLKDLIGPHLAAGGEILFGATCTGIHGAETDAPLIAFLRDGRVETIDCDFVVAADGLYGVGRQAIPAAELTIHEKIHPFGWLAIVARAPQSWHEVIYASQNDGFALLGSRSPEEQRMYLQCDPADDVAQWSDDRIWTQLQSRLGHDGWTLDEGPILQKQKIRLRSFVCEPMQHGRLFLAGDAAHLLPPTGAKGLNLAAADALILSRALTAWYRRNRGDLLNSYTETCLRRVWKAQRFAWYMTAMMHRPGQESSFERAVRFAEIDLLRTSYAAARSLAENYVGLPFD